MRTYHRARARQRPRRRSPSRRPRGLAACSVRRHRRRVRRRPRPPAASTSPRPAARRTIVIQTDWNPEAEHGHLYELLGADSTIDAGKKSVSGPLMLERRVHRRQRRDPLRRPGDRLPDRDAARCTPTPTSPSATSPPTRPSQLSAEHARPRPSSRRWTKNPQMIMWDPATYPDVKTIADLGKTGAVVRYFGGSAYMDYLIGAGILPSDQVDGSYDGTPAELRRRRRQGRPAGLRLGRAVHLRERGHRPGASRSSYQLIHDAGYPIYAVGDVGPHRRPRRSSRRCLKARARAAAGRGRLLRRPGAGQHAHPRPGRRSTTPAGSTRRASPTTRSRR